MCTENCLTGSRVECIHNPNSSCFIFLYFSCKLTLNFYKYFSQVSTKEICVLSFLYFTKEIFYILSRRGTINFSKLLAASETVSASKKNPWPRLI